MEAQGIPEQLQIDATHLKAHRTVKSLLKYESITEHSLLMMQEPDVENIVWHALIYCRISSKKQLKGSGDM